MRLRAYTPILALLVVAASAGLARASEYPGWGDTGWVYESKRECCNYAIEIASQYSEQACTTSGGMPSPFVGGGQRGSCSSQWTQDDNGYTWFRCYGETSVWCD
jgi:hypothetical protein